MPWVEPGWLGGRGASTLTLLFGRIGALVLTTLFLLVGILSLTGISTGTTLSTIGRGLRWALAWALWVGELVWTQVQRVAHMIAVGVRGFVASLGQGLARVRESINSISVRREQRARRSRVQEHLQETQDQLAAPEETNPFIEVEDRGSEEAAAPVAVLAEPEDQPKPAARKLRPGEEPDIVDHTEERRKTKKPEQEAFRFHDKGPAGPFQLPEVSLFTPPPVGERTYDRDSLLMNSKILEKKLSDFGVTGRVVRVHPGPVITMYEYEPAAGIKVNKIVGLTDDLTMALRAISIRIIRAAARQIRGGDRSPESQPRNRLSAGDARIRGIPKE